MKLIAIYARVSTTNQEKKETITNQIDSLHVYAAQNGFTIVKEYKDDGWSGGILARPGLDELRNDAKKKIWEAVLIYDPDRLARNYAYQVLIMDELEKLKIEVIFVTMPAPKTESEMLMHKLMSGVRGLFAEYEKAKITDRFRLGKVRTVQHGHVVTSQAPYGYNYILNQIAADKSINYGGYEINPEESKVLKDIFNWIDKESLTIRGVIKRLQKLGIKPRKSERKVWSTSTLSTLLRNKTLIGEAYWGKTYAVEPENPKNKNIQKKNPKSSRRNNPEEKWVANKIPVPAIIDREQFFRVGKRLADNFALLQRKKKNEYLLAGKIHCSCGRLRHGEGPQHGKHLYYRCSDRVYSFPLPPNCKERGINARIADNLVWQKLLEFMSSPELIREQIDRWLVERRDNIRSSIPDIEPIKKEILKLKNQKARLANAFANGTFEENELKELITPIKDRITKLEEQINDAERKEISVKTIATPSEDEIAEFAEDAKKTLNSLNFEEKQAIIRIIIDKLIGTQKQLQFSGFIPLISNYNYVEYKTECGNCRPPKCWQINPL